MNRNRWSSCLYFLAGCWILTLCSAGFAQEQARRGAADIPFEFYIAGNKLPAGQYTLDLIAPTYVMLRSHDGKFQQALYFVQTAVADNKPVSQIVFVVREGKHYFSEVWGWFGKAQLTSFTPQVNEETKEVPLKPAEAEKEAARPGANS